MNAPVSDSEDLYEEELFEPAPRPAATKGKDKSSKGHDSNPWPVLAPTAYHGLAGKVVATLEPHTESDPVALLVQYLTSFGNVVGRQPHYLVESTQHFGNLFMLLVGVTSKSRKGTSGERIHAIYEVAAPDWARTRVQGGMSSGEGVLWQVRDPILKMKKGVEVLDDPGVEDKRLLLDEREFFQALVVMRREGSILSRVVREAWDCRAFIASLTKHSPAHATQPFISIIGHITADELKKQLDEASMANGYANRFLFACVKRSKLLPHGGALEPTAVIELGRATQQAVDAARKLGRVTMTPDAARRWEDIYAALANEQPGLIGAITARGEPQTLRLALIYSLLDQSSQIEVAHLEAALALWRFCEASARHIFGDLVGDPLADDILAALRNAGAAGMSRTELRDFFGRNQSGGTIGAALGKLLKAGKARVERNPAPRGPWMRETWFAT